MQPQCSILVVCRRNKPIKRERSPPVSRMNEVVPACQWKTKLRTISFLRLPSTCMKRRRYGRNIAEAYSGSSSFLWRDQLTISPNRFMRNSRRVTTYAYGLHGGQNRDISYCSKSVSEVETGALCAVNSYLIEFDPFYSTIRRWIYVVSCTQHWKSQGRI